MATLTALTKPYAVFRSSTGGTAPGTAVGTAQTQRPDGFGTSAPAHVVVRLQPPEQPQTPSSSRAGTMGWQAVAPDATNAGLTPEQLATAEAVKAQALQELGAFLSTAPEGGRLEVQLSFISGGEMTGLMEAAKAARALTRANVSVSTATDCPVPGDTITLTVDFAEPKAPAPAAPSAPQGVVVDLQPTAWVAPAQPGQTSVVVSDATSGRLNEQAQATASRIHSQALEQVESFMGAGAPGGQLHVRVKIDAGGELTGMMSAASDVRARWAGATASVSTATDVPVAGDTVTLNVSVA